MSEARAHSADAARVEAAAWLERVSQDADDGEAAAAATRAAFERWLAASPDNPRLFGEIAGARTRIKAAGDVPEIRALRDQTLSRLARRRGGVWGRARAKGAAIGSQWGRPALAAGLAAVLLGGAGVWLSAQRGGDHPALAAAAAPDSALYRTGVGEQSTIELTDGSRIMLNTDSAVRVAYSAQARRIILERGQAYFAVAKDASRPFTVKAGDRLVTATGTAFDVRLSAAAVQVVLVEGRVTVGPSSPAAARRDVVALRPSDMLIAARTTQDVVKAADVATETAWRDGLLFFHDSDLRAAVAEMNRYSATRIVLKDNAVAGMRISGTFRVGQSVAFVEGLRDTLPIRIVSRGDDEIVLAAD